MNGNEIREPENQKEPSVDESLEIDSSEGKKEKTETNSADTAMAKRYGLTPQQMAEMSLYL